MKVLIKVIIWIFFLFSIVSTSFAQTRWQIETILDLNYWIENSDINSIKIDNYYFNNYETYRIHNAFNNASVSLKNEIIRQYRNNNIDYYTMKWIIVDYKNFIYYSNKYFYLMKQKEKYTDNKALDYAIIKNMTLVKSYYTKMKFLILK